MSGVIVMLTSTNSAGLTQAGSIVWNGVLLASAVVPVLIVIVLCFYFMRAARRNDEREALEKQNQRPVS